MTADEWIWTPLTQERMGKALELCDACVGKNLYTKADLADVMDSSEKQFFFLMTPDETAAAYIYFRLINLEEAERLSKLRLLQMGHPAFEETALIGNLQSIGVRPEYRHQGLSKRLVERYLQWLMNESKADMAFGVFWKPEGKVPMESTLKKFGFHHLVDSPRVWYDKKDLICPVCRGRCSCDAAIYYKVLERKEL